MRLKIAFTGPESSGKSTLSKWVSEAYSIDLVKEYARDYLNDYGPYNQMDLDKIAQEQFNRNEGSKKPTILDTEMLVMRIWCEEKFGTCSDLIKSLFVQQHIDIYFLCKPDFKWQEDPLRESPNDRERLFDLYVFYLEKMAIPFHILEGDILHRKDKIAAIMKTC
jgi:nicotinamide riboside kinase